MEITHNSFVSQGTSLNSAVRAVHDDSVASISGTMIFAEKDHQVGGVSLYSAIFNSFSISPYAEPSPLHVFGSR